MPLFFVLAVILSAAKDPEAFYSPIPFVPFSYGLLFLAQLSTSAVVSTSFSKIKTASSRPKRRPPHFVFAVVVVFGVVSGYPKALAFGPPGMLRLGF
jgi:hypothetical protein